MIPAAVREPDAAAQRGHIDDPSAALRAHEGQRQLRHGHCAQQVHIQLLFCFAQRHVLYRAAAAIACVVNQHVQPPLLAPDDFKADAARRLVGYVEGKHPRAERRQIAHALRASGGGVNNQSARKQRLGGAFADAGGSAGNQYDLRPIHFSSPYSKYSHSSRPLYSRRFCAARLPKQRSKPVWAVITPIPHGAWRS